MRSRSAKIASKASASRGGDGGQLALDRRRARCGPSPAARAWRGSRRSSRSGGGRRRETLRGSSRQIVARRVRLGPLSLDIQVEKREYCTWMPSKVAGPPMQPTMATKESKVELLQGTLDLIVLRALSTMGPQHAYGLAARLEQVADHPLNLNQGTLYPALVDWSRKAGSRAPGRRRKTTARRSTTRSRARVPVRSKVRPNAAPPRRLVRQAVAPRVVA